MNNNRNAEPSRIRLFVVVILGNLSSFTLGTAIAWPSPIMPKLKGQTEDSPLNFPIDRDQQGWIFSIISIGAGISAVGAGSLADTIGRKYTMMAASFFFIAAYATTALVTSLEVLYIGRLLQGLGAGTTMTVVPMYVGEISTKDVRGSTLSLMLLFMTLGMLFVYCIGPFTDYENTQLSCLVFPTLTFWSYLLIPESPYYLVSLNAFEEALESLQTVRGQDIETLKIELQEIKAAIEEANAEKQGKCNDVLENATNRRAAIICMGLMVFQQFSGAVIMIINSQSIFELANTHLQPAYCSIIVAIVQVCSSTTLEFVVDTLKRRTLLRWSALGMGISQFILGTYLFINTKQHIPTQYQWLPLFAFILFQFSYRVGFGPLPFTVLGEICATNVKAIVSTSVTITCWGLGSLITRFYPVFDAYGSHFVFWTFAMFCGLAFLFAQFVVMETKGFSLAEIQHNLHKN